MGGGAYNVRNCFEALGTSYQPQVADDMFRVQHILGEVSEVSNGVANYWGTSLTTTEVAMETLSGLYAKLGASSWYEALAHGWGLGLIRSGRVSEDRGHVYSIRSNAPGHARAASVGSYGL